MGGNSSSCECFLHIRSTKKWDAVDRVILGRHPRWRDVISFGGFPPIPEIFTQKNFRPLDEAGSLEKARIQIPAGIWEVTKWAPCEGRDAKI